MREVKRVGLIGGGVIGSAWAARLLINGIDVDLFDPADGVERRINDVLENIEKLNAGHSELHRPQSAGRSIGIPGR
jgi:carnitine 3-dehydrogenase